MIQVVLFLALLGCALSFQIAPSTRQMIRPSPALARHSRASNLQMNVVEDAIRFFSNMKKEASAKHILMKGTDASAKLLRLKEELDASEDVSAAFSEIAAKVRDVLCKPASFCEFTSHLFLSPFYILLHCR
jgi:predicted LPLAT superfamily acyltransferase